MQAFKILHEYAGRPEPDGLQTRQCMQFYCFRVQQQRCCADCPHRSDCPDPCLNDPSRCGLELKKGKKEDEQ